MINEIFTLALVIYGLSIFVIHQSFIADKDLFNKLVQNTLKETNEKYLEMYKSGQITRRTYFNIKMSEKSARFWVKTWIITRAPKFAFRSAKNGFAPLELLD